MAEGRWEPILDRRLTEQARTAVRAIGDDLASFATEPAHLGVVALYWAYAAGIWDDDATNARYAEATGRLVDRIGSEYHSHLLFDGLAGDGWVVSHVSTDSGELLDMVDRELLAVLAPEPAWPGSYDLIQGLVGLGVYFLERLANDPAAAAPRDGIAHVVRHLDQLREPRPGGTWRTPPDQLPPWHLAAFPDGYYNCGLAHGVPGIVGVLGRIAALEDPPARTRPLLADATGWVWAQQLPPSPRGRFPAFFADAAKEPTRTAWCYGDPGVAIALWSAAQRAGQPVAAARTLALEVAQRDPAHCGITDAGICHGAVGMGHILNRFYQASGDPVFRSSAIDWYERALANRTPGTGIGGYLTPPMLPPGQTGAAIPTAGLLEGATGIGLALMAGFHDSEPSWDRMLLCDLAVRAEP
jgi:hypothetical protein